MASERLPNISYFFEAPPLWFARFYTGLVTLRNQLVTPIRLMGRRVIELYDALLSGNDMEITPRLTLQRRPGYINYCTSGILNGTLLNTYSWKTASLGTFQIFDTTVDIEYIPPNSTSPTVIFTKPVGSIGSKGYMFGVGNYLFVSGNGFAFKWDGPTGSQGVTNWGISIANVANSVGPSAVGTGANINGAAWTNPTNIQANDGAVSTVLVAGIASGKVASAGLLEGTNLGFSVPATTTISGIQVDVRGFVGQDFTLRPTAHTGTYSNPTLAYDGNFGTACTGVVTQGGGGSSKSQNFSAFPVNPGGAPIILNISSSVLISGSGCEVLLTWTSNKGSGTVYDITSSRTKQTDTIVLDPTTDTSTVIVTASETAPGGAGSAAATHSIFEVWIQTGSTTGTKATNLALTLLKNGSLVGNTYTATLGTSDGFVSYGGPSDLWGTTWVANDVNQTNFGAGIVANVINSVSAFLFSVDYVQITVFGSGGPTVTVSGAGGSVNAVNGWSYVFAYGNSVSGEISNASGASANTGPITNKAGVTVALTASTDPQVNQIRVYRTVDAGGGTIFYELPTSPYPNTTGNVTDTAADTSLQVNNQASTALQNTPPPANLIAMEWFAGRMWGVVGSQLFFSTGPDSISGLQQSNWNPAYVFVLPNTSLRLTALPNGMLVHTLEDIKVVRGISTTSFTVNDFIKDVGTWNYNAVDTDGSNVYVFTADRQFVTITAAGVEEVGGGVIADQLQSIDPTQAYVAMYRSGLDAMIFLLDTAKQVLYPFNSRQQAWCLPALPKFTNMTAAGTMETQPGVWKYLIGTGTSLAQRDLNTFSDLGTAYAPNVVIGTIQEADPGTLAKVENLYLELTNAGSAPIVSVLANDAGVTLTNAPGSQITGTFTAITNPVNDPPTYGAIAQNYRSLRYQWLTMKLPEAVKYVQILLQFPAEAAQNEVLGLGLSGKQEANSPAAGQLPQLQGH
jgi:hypothetical protein